MKVALIGCGRIAGHHCRAVKATDGLELAALCDLVEDKARQWSDEGAIPVYTSYRAMLAAHPDVDVVAVITPSGMHHEHGREMIERYGKHVILEKPAVMRPAQLAELADLAAARGRRLFTVFQNRHNKAVRRVRSALGDGELGEPRILSVRVRWCRPQRYYDLAPWRGTFSHDGGALTNQGIHHVDLLRYLGGEVKRVSARMRTLGANVEVEDTAVATVEFESGAVGSVEVTTAARPVDYEASLSVVGAAGLAQIGGIAVNELQVFSPDPDACAAHSEDFSDCVYGFGHFQLYRDVREDLAGGAPYPVTIADCTATLDLLHAFYRADEAGGWVSPGGQSARLGRPDEALSDLYRTPDP